jgi:hypothetical protein
MQRLREQGDHDIEFRRGNHLPHVALLDKENRTNNRAIKN